MLGDNCNSICSMRSGSLTNPSEMRLSKGASKVIAVSLFFRAPPSLAVCMRRCPLCERAVDGASLSFRRG